MVAALERGRRSRDRRWHPRHGSPRAATQFLTVEIAERRAGEGAAPTVTSVLPKGTLKSA